MTETETEAPTVPVPRELIEKLREAAHLRGYWLHEAITEACRAWLAGERRRRRRLQSRRVHPKSEQIEAQQVRRLVGLHLSRSEASEVLSFVAWLRESSARDVAFWRGVIQ